MRDFHLWFSKHSKDCTIIRWYTTAFQANGIFWTQLRETSPFRIDDTVAEALIPAMFRSWTSQWKTLPRIILGSMLTGRKQKLIDLTGEETNGEGAVDLMGGEKREIVQCTKAHPGPKD